MKTKKKQDKTTDKEILQVNNAVGIQVPNDAGEKLISLSNNPNFVQFNYPNLEVQLDVYTDIENAFLGVSGQTGGTKVVTLNKYNNDTTFFDINNVIAKKIGYKTDFLNSTGWVDAGTIISFRFETFTKDPTSEDERVQVYVSDTLFAANGYTRSLEDDNLETLGFVYNVQNNNYVSLLTHQPVKQYVIGQTEYLNFVLKDSTHGSGNDFNFGIKYNDYPQ
ncbi:hypothetical protein EZS27_018398 [termite gut metagenome]|uniref:Uncharacterized protein n=1 Tax=termite gut metagenome TaxID=433724 RepID=A0A5J4RJZ1_9ZZZZ